MNTESTAVTISAAAIEAETERLIQKAAERNNLSADSIREQVQVEAREQALKNLEQAAKDESNPYRKLYEQERAQREIAESTLASIRTQGIKHGGGNTGGAPVSAAQAEARAGALQWNHKMTPQQKIAALGVDPSTVNLKEAKRIFGRGSDPKLGSDLHKADPVKYRVLREVSKATGLYGA